MDSVYLIIGAVVVVGSPMVLSLIRMSDQRKLAAQKLTERETSAVARIVTIENHIEQMKTDITHAHDKIRDLDSRQSATNDTLISIQGDLRHITAAVDKISEWIERQRSS